MVVQYLLIFSLLLGAYLIASVWAGLDPRYPSVMAVILLATAAGLNSVGDAAATYILAQCVFVLLLASVGLLIISRAEPAPPIGATPTEQLGSGDSEDPSPEA